MPPRPALPGIALPLALLCFGPALHAEPMPAPATAQYAEQLAAPTAGKCTTVAVDLENSPNFTATALDARHSELRYRMAWNNVAEGWSWQPGSDPERSDYYRFKFLPLQSVNEQRSAYRAEDKIGTSQEMQVLWRYDYFLAFENLYDFYPRSIDDDAGFTLVVAGPPPAHPVMLASACLEVPVTSESTTFWKATYSHPEDYTLKKRYLIGHLERIAFADGDSGEVLGVIEASEN